MASATLLIVGSEMLDPDRRDANGPAARQRLAELGIPLAAIVRVEDRIDAIAAATRAALELSEVVIASGGLGPTGDDVTREGVALLLGREVVEDGGWIATLEGRYRARGRLVTDAGRRQALVVSGGETIPNPVGLACGSWIEHGARVIALLPGVPSEFARMMDDFVVPRLARRYPDPADVRVVRAIAAGLPEADAEPVLAPWYRQPGVAISVLPVMGVLRVTFTLTAPPADDAAKLETAVRAALRDGLGHHLVSLDGALPEQVLGERLLERGWTLAGAESCTGGTAARKVVTIPGASRYFLGAIEAYSDDVKQDLLGVPAATLEQHGAVSEETALAMAYGAQRLFGADCAFATTGIAGPDGGTPEKPVGLVYVAAVTPDRTAVRRLLYPLDRVSVMELSANYALYHLLRLLSPR